MRRSSRLQKHRNESSSSSTTQNNNINTYKNNTNNKKKRSSSLSSSKPSKPSKPSKLKKYTPKPPNRSRRRSIGRKYKNNKTTYGQGGGATGLQYFEDRNNDRDIKRNQYRRQQYPITKKIQMLKQTISDQ